MLKPQQQNSELLLNESPVFGKPWFWQRSRSVMESTRSLAEVIMEMRDEIKKLEVENRDLRRDYHQQSLGNVPGKVIPASVAAEQWTGVEENPYVNLRRNSSAPVLEGQYKENTIMTVRRYSISSNLSGVTMREGWTDGKQQSHSEWGILQKEIQHGNSVFGHSARGDVGRVSNRHSLQEYVHKNRAKVKTVTFLLPVDDIYTNRPVLTKHQEGSKVKLASLTETES
ncbi:putative coiled-coil domain-containing protein 195 [Antennarius striatus]|uniref:putative coiled-coil domain-containing protein 195 n=1 Tax=Antennarius striatus TaxID=241820 RepID=UPI0035B4211A